MNIIRTVTLVGTTPVDTCTAIMTESNQLWLTVGYCGDTLYVSQSFLNTLQDTKPFFNKFDEAKDGVIGLANGVIRVYMDDSLEENACVISYKDTGIKLIKET